MLLLLAIGRAAAAQAEDAARRAYAASIANDPKAVTSAMRRAHTVQAAVRTAEPDAGAVKEGSDGAEAAVRAARRVYSASGLAHDPKAVTSAVRHVCTARGIEEEADNASVDNDQVASSRRRRPTTATTIADAANVDIDEATNGRRRRSKTVSDGAGINNDEVGGRLRPSRRRRTLPASTTTRLRAAGAPVPPTLMTMRPRTAGAAVLRPTSTTTRPRTAGAAGPPTLLLLAVGRSAAA